MISWKCRIHHFLITLFVLYIIRRFLRFIVYFIGLISCRLKPSFWLPLSLPFLAAAISLLCLSIALLLIPLQKYGSKSGSSFPSRSSRTIARCCQSVQSIHGFLIGGPMMHHGNFRRDGRIDPWWSFVVLHVFIIVVENHAVCSTVVAAVVIVLEREKREWNGSYRTDMLCKQFRTNRW